MTTTFCMSQFDASVAKSAGSSPRFLAYDPSLMAATWPDPLETLVQTPTNRGHLVESAVGCYLLAQSKVQGFDLMWWREGNSEVDYVVRKGSRICAIEVDYACTIIPDTSSHIRCMRRLPTPKSRASRSKSFEVTSSTARVEPRRLPISREKRSKNAINHKLTHGSHAPRQ